MNNTKNAFNSVINRSLFMYSDNSVREEEQIVEYKEILKNNLLLSMYNPYILS